MHRVASSALVLALAAFNASAQGAVRGVVVDERSNKPLACLDVALIDSTGRVLQRTQSSRSGEFSFSSAVSDPVLLRFSAHGLMPSPYPVASPRDSAGIATYPLIVEPLESGALPEPLGARDAGPGYVPGDGWPRYPDELRAIGITGHVLMGFAIDARGRPITTSVVELDATHDAFRDAVRAALPRVRFRPARRDGQEACVFWVQEFRFDLANRRP